jgi:hypothetical protein
MANLLLVHRFSQRRELYSLLSEKSSFLAVQDKLRALWYPAGTMLTSKVIAAFGGNLSAVARAAGCTRQAVQQWGKLVPIVTARRLAKLHGLKLREEDYEEVETVRRERIRRAMRKRTLEDRASSAE